MGPSEKFSKVVRVLRICSGICGCDILDKNFKITTITYCVAACITFYFTCIGYTVYLNISSFIPILESLCFIGCAIQGTTKFCVGIMYTKILCKQCDLLTDVYKIYETKGKNYSLVLDKCISRVQVVLQLAACLYGVAFVALIITPLGIFAFTELRFLPLQLALPLFDTDTNFGYFATVGMQSILLFFALCGNFVSDMFLLVYFAHSSLFVDIFKIKADELNNLAIDFGSQKVKDQLKNVIDWHQTYSNFIEQNEAMFFWVNFVQITTSGLSIVFTLVLMFISDWPGSYVYTWLAFSMLYLYCGTGTLVEVANERFADEIYAIHWYLLTIPQQKTIRFMLMKSQSPKVITVGGVVPLSVSTGLQVTKSAYSFYMMMLNFLHKE